MRQAQEKKPNILVIFGDDVGQSNISVYTHGLMGYKTSNIDRIAREGMLFTDYYAENSCTAGRSTFITGQSPWRTGLSKVGIPGATVGLQPRDITIAEALKPLGYATAQFGKNHLGDRDEFLPTNHGFDEFFGNLYHLNAEEEPERPYYPKDDPAFVKAYNPRGVIHSSADGKITDTGPLNRKRMETIDDETTNAAIDFIQRQVKADKPFFVWMNTTRMHVFTHAAKRTGARAACLETSTPTACGSTTRTWASCSRRWTTSASPTIPSSSTPPTTARTCSPGPTPR
jgi:arylsulfatase A-like enzyme